MRPLLLTLLTLTTGCGFMSQKALDERLAEYDFDGDGVVNTEHGGEDCDDYDASVFPGADESCNGVDDDCDGIPDNNAGVPSFVDADGDGLGDLHHPAVICPGVAGYVDNSDDCDDTDREVTYGDWWYPDVDEDGFGDGSGTLQPIRQCEAPGGSWVLDHTDCDDGNGAIHPSAAEVCNGVDDDCVAGIDQGATDAAAWYIDGDGDGRGDQHSTPLYACFGREGYVNNSDDCDDTARTIYKGAPTACDLQDTDCDGDVEEVVVAEGGPLTIQQALDQAHLHPFLDPDHPDGWVCVDKGLYLETLVFPQRSVVLESAFGSAETTLDAEGAGSVVTIDGSSRVPTSSGDPEADNAARKELIDHYRPSLVGFSITGGQAALGAGIYVDYASPDLVDLVIHGNTAAETTAVPNGHVTATHGAGMALLHSKAVGRGITVRDNKATCTGDCVAINGGVVSITAGAPVLRGLSIRQNRCEADATSGQDLLLDGCALRVHNALPTLAYLDITDNLATASGATVTAEGGMVGMVGRASPVIQNATIAGNEITSPGFVRGLITTRSDSETTLVNVDVSHNLIDGELGANHVYARGVVPNGQSSPTSSFVFRFTNTFGNTALGVETRMAPDIVWWPDKPAKPTGNQMFDPLYVSPGDYSTPGDYHLQDSSPLIDAGDPGVLSAQGTPSDISAFERSLP